MKITAYDELYSIRVATGGTTIISATGSNSGLTGGDVVGEPGDLSVIGLRSSVSLGSNLGTGVAVGDTLTIISTAGTPVARFATPSNSGGVSFGSNAMAVGATNQAGTSGTYIGADHRHLGLHTVTSSASNTLQRPTLNLRPGTGMAITASDTDGDGVFDTATIGLASPRGDRAAIIWTVDGGGSAITTGDKGFLTVPFACTITHADLEADASTTTTMNVKKRAMGGGAASSIVAAAKPTLTAQTESRDSTLSGWTTAVNAFDKLYFAVDSNNNAKLLTLTLTVLRA